MIATCSPLPLTLACQDDPYKRDAARCSSAFLQCLYGEVVGNHVFRGATVQPGPPGCPISNSAVLC